MTIKINPDECIGCAQCADICLFDAIDFDGYTAVHNPEKCDECGGCVKVCPNEAISEE